MEKLSVIVPAYNCEKSIERCLNSILAQTYANLQLIVIDDGSIDSTDEIVHSMLTADERIHLISIANAGVSHARNIGIDFALGEYITFVDADDYLEPEMYGSLMNLIHTYHVKISHCSYQNVNEDGTIINKVGNSGKVLVQNHDEAIEYLLLNKMFGDSLWNKIYHRSLFSNIRLDESLRFYEDVLANFLLFNQSTYSVFVDCALYSYVSNFQSATHTKKGFTGAEQALYVAHQIDYLSLGKPYEEYAKSKVALKMLTLYKDYIYNKDNEVSAKRRNLRIELKQYKQYLDRRNDRIAYYLLMYFPLLYKIVFKIYSKQRVKLLDPL